MKIAIEVDPNDFNSLLTGVRFLKTLPGWSRDEEAHDVPPVPIAQAIEEAHAEIATESIIDAVLARGVTATEDEAAQAMRTYYAAKGVPAAVQLLAEFGVARVTDMNPEQRGAFVEKVRTAA